MARRPDDWMVKVELVDEERATGPASAAPEPAGTGTPAPGASTGPMGGVATAASRRPRRAGWVLPVAGVVLVTVGVVGGVGLLRGDHDADLRLDSPLEGVWTLDHGTLLGSADGVVVVRTGGSVEAYAEDDGELLWEVGLGVPAVVDVCAPTVTTAPATLWCWRNEQAVRSETGATEQRHAALVGLSLRDGEVAVERRMAVPWAGVVAAGEDLVVADRVRENLTIRRLDPRSWEVEWATPLTLMADPVSGEYRATVDAEGGVVVVDGPTAAVVDADDGHVLQTWGPSVDEQGAVDARTTAVTVTPHGFAAESRRTDGRLAGHGIWYDAAGREVVEYTGVLAEPASSDGSEPGVVLVTREHGTEMVGVDTATGRALWTLPTEDAAVLSRHEGSVVVATGGSVTAVELLTGWQLWHADVAGLRSDAGHASDGDVALVMAVQDRAWSFVALDLQTGATAWSSHADGTPDLGDLFFIGGAPRLEVVGGHLVVRSGQGTTWLG